MNINTPIILILITFFCACQKKQQTPKPRVYPKVIYPSHSYALYHPQNCPFHFEKPVYTNAVKKKIPNLYKPESNCWFTLTFPQFSGELYFTYNPCKSITDVDRLKTETFEIIDHINKRSNYMEEYTYQNDEGVSGLIFEFKGPAASPMQFYLTDTQNHFVNGAFYFHTKVNPDSLTPISSFIKKDIKHILASFRWEK